MKTSRVTSHIIHDFASVSPSQAAIGAHAQWAPRKRKPSPNGPSSHRGAGIDRCVLPRVWVWVGCGIAAIPSLPVNDADALTNSGGGAVRYLPCIRRQRVTRAIEEEEAAEKQHAPFESFPRATRALHDGDGERSLIWRRARGSGLCAQQCNAHIVGARLRSWISGTR
jgi:hypothetical protein